MNDRQIEGATMPHEEYVAPQLTELGTLADLTAGGHYSLIGGGDLPVLSSVTG